ncbi:MAG: OsmC family peroxiredoxin [Pseudonocardia sp.]|uniref:OsmC family peroxiredoxin n=1 Tax=unclassified Pseudonocardia TaxID=2619320 RepID=UPI00086A8E70|nr:MULTISPECIES: OsmC family peroxiredoxin [unclassified Pseudonocardia]MBN9113683.1 OsmC family peroxiredoxin [Pseudonocardia sp.]ODU99317.1 MAG: peroxiredoxin [Pseudonocardia sp. SCN 73-27]
MPARTSTAVWNGDLESGTGQMVVGNNAYTGDFSFKSRFEEGAGTNPEELIAAAHAGCYSMQLSAMLAGAGKNPTSVSTKAHVTLQIVDEKPTITKIALDTVGVVPGLSADEFAQFAEDAKAACLVTRALAGVENVTLKAELGG